MGLVGWIILDLLLRNKFRSLCASLFWLALPVAFAVCLSAQMRSGSKADRQAHAEMSVNRLLRESVTNSRQFIPEERGWLLFRLSQVARNVGRKEAAAFAHQAFQWPRSPSRWRLGFGRSCGRAEGLRQSGARDGSIE